MDAGNILRLYKLGAIGNHDVYPMIINSIDQSNVIVILSALPVDLRSDFFSWINWLAEDRSRCGSFICEDNIDIIIKNMHAF